MSFFPELYFNVDNGYLEGLVRGLKAGVLSQADYLNLVQCETLEVLSFSHITPQQVVDMVSWNFESGKPEFES
ncbi:V-type proton ATPase subunit d 1 [Fukomys damarensis]|uniref:V-type proton ATPase subunit d 1 n=1 Tax=Fukomys damarensis TaxID=885580 RepID=A0A091CMB9_FUKDA|nr:V-type proton ATPase subunit d 1 [Fukomys damarensis]